ncbi:hypothetical protein JNUCC64_30670 [Streptomyces sp. JNUCC 64]
MTVRYIRVNPVADLFSPAVRAFGNVALVGTVTVPAAPPGDLLAVGVPVAFSEPGEALRRAPGALGTAVATAFAQSPGPSLVYAVRVDGASPDWAAALLALSGVDVQIVALADTPLDPASGAPAGAVGALAAHVSSVSGTGADGRERIGVAMLAKDAADPTVVTGALALDRMVYVAHKSDEDVGAAVAGTIAGYEPHVSLLLKQVNVSSGTFTQAEIEALNGPETFTSGPAGRGVNWLVDPALLPGQAVCLGEAYTGRPDGKKFIDVVRTVDQVSFLLKARLIRSVGRLRISRSGLRALIAQLEAVLDPLVGQEVIEGYQVLVPILALLDRPRGTLTETERARVDAAQAERLVEVVTSVDYAGAVHRLSITLRFE